MPHGNRYQTARFELSTVTPVHIGTDRGALLSPYTDFFVTGQGQNTTVTYIDHRKFEQQLLHQPGLIDRFVQGVAEKVDNTRSTFRLTQFLREAGIQPGDVAGIRLPGRGLRDDDRIQIMPALKTNGQAYIPGSSLKGALRTALWYDWLSDDGSHGGHQQVKTWLGQISACYQRCKSKLNEIGKLERDQVSLARSRQRLSQEQYRRLMDLRRWVEQQVREQIRISDADLMGDIFAKDHTRLEARHIRTGDSSPAGSEGGQAPVLGVYMTQRLNLATGRLTVPQVREAIRPGQRCQFRLEAVSSLEHAWLRIWNERPAEELLRVCGNFSSAALRLEGELLDGLDTAETSETEAYRRQLDSIDAQLDKLKDHEAMLRIGAGKTYYFNSIGMAILDADAEVFRQFRALFGLRPRQDIFPITRTVLSGGGPTDGTPLGWVKVTLNK